jgi:Txe/YoeB family toxin of Txe-Axe toxin-antitoxin module
VKSWLRNRIEVKIQELSRFNMEPWSGTSKMEALQASVHKIASA